MALTRRQFLKRSATLAAGATVAPSMKWLPGTKVAYAAGPGDAIVVFVQLYGGNDGLNTVYPLGGGQRTKYVECRPTLALPTAPSGLTRWADAGYDTSNGILGVGDDDSSTPYALHPAMKAMHDLYNSGNLAIVPGVHYPYADYSHFKSEVIYYTGDPIVAAGSGWMGKYFDLAGFGGTEVPAVMLGSDYNPLFTPTGTGLFAFNRLSELRFPSRGTLRTERSQAYVGMCTESAASDPAYYPELASIGTSGVAAVNKFEQYYLSGDGLDAAGPVEKLLLNGEGRYDVSNPLVYASPLNPEQGLYGATNLTDDMRHVAAIIRADVGARFFHVAIGGFDSHSNQEDGLYHSSLLYQVSEAIGALYAELSTPVSLPPGYESHPYLTGDLSSKVLIVTLSEFGRTNRQNAAAANTAGTDHGGSSVQFVVGSTVQAGIHGTYPTLSDPLLDNDMRMAFDFRDFYGTILERWLNVPSSDIGPGPGKLFAATPNPDWLGQSYNSYTPIPFLLP